MEEDIDAIDDDQNPVRQNIEIHRQRLINVLDRMIEKIEIAFCLEDLVENDGKLLSPYLNINDVKYVCDVYYGNLSEIKSSRTIQVKAKSQDKLRRQKSTVSKLTLMESKQEVHNANMVALLHFNQEIRKLAKDLIAQKSCKDIEFLLYMKELREIAVKRFYTTATEERVYNKHVRTIFKTNERLKYRNDEMVTMRDKKISELAEKLYNKNYVLENQKRRIDEMKVKCIEDLQKSINNSEKIMAQTALGSEEKQELLSENEKIIRTQYQQLLDQHLAHEKALRIKRYKVETVLANWLAKYDQDIGDIQNEYEGIYNEYDKERQALEDLKTNFEEQTIEYDILMQEKIDEEQRIFEKKYYQFILNRSVRIIQRWWKAIYRKRYKRRKGKKGKKK